MPFVFRKFYLGYVLIFGLLLAACGGPEQTLVVPTPTAQSYVPPTQDPAVLQLQETETARLTAVSLPSPTPNCKNDLRFLDDISVPDGSAVASGKRLDKRWKVENSGSCNWDIEYEIRLIAGPDMDASSPQALFPALSGTEVEIRMLFKAPDEPGSYRSAWQAFDPQGNPFGETFFIDIVVSNE
jgi:hypothetical protein